MPSSTINFPEIKIENALTGVQYNATLVSSSGYTAYYDVNGVPMPPNPRINEWTPSEDKIYEFWIYLNNVKYPKSAYVTVLGDKDDISDLEFRVTRFESENPVLPPEGGSAHFIIEINAEPVSPVTKSQAPVIDDGTVVVDSNEITGTGIPGGSIEVTINDVSAGTEIVDGAGIWSMSITPLVLEDIVKVTQIHDGLAPTTVTIEVV